jgi:uncharacterized iron-regulated membrane protein
MKGNSQPGAVKNLIARKMGRGGQSNSTLLKQRKIWLAVHTYIALGVGFIFAVLGLTGSLSVYREEIDELLNPELVIENPRGEYQSLDTILAAVKQAHPDRYGGWTLELPRTSHSMLTAWFEKPRETYFERYAPLIVSVNPYTAEVVASRFWGQTVTTWLLDWHTQLQLGENGWQLIGYSGLLLLLSVCSGLYLWWPGLRQLVKTFKLTISRGWMRLLLDLHRTLGFFSSLALLILALTGVNLSFPKVLENLAGASGMAHGETGAVIVSTSTPNDHPVYLEAAEFVARGPFPKAELRRVTTPDGETGVYRINLRQKNEFNLRHPYTTVWVDRWSGQIRELRDPKGFNFGQRVITWIWPLHTGEALGGFGRFCWFLAGLTLCFLYVSGVMRYCNRLGWVPDRAVNLNAPSTMYRRFLNYGKTFSYFVFGLLMRGLTKIEPYTYDAVNFILKKLTEAFRLIDGKTRK